MPTTQIPEIDRITNALRVSGARVDRMLSTERHFTADATHQLRSGLTGIAMRFEILARHANADVVDEALAGLSQTEQLNTTIDELLAATRDSTTRERTTFDLVTVVDDHVAEWSPRFAEARRSIAVITMETSRVVGTKGLAGQVIDILIDNALRHGRGSVTLLVEDTSVTVIDQGPGLSDAAGQIRVRGTQRSLGTDTAAACPSPDAWHRSTAAASTSPPPVRCASGTGSCAPDRTHSTLSRGQRQIGQGQAGATGGRGPESGPKNQSPPPGGGNPGGGERKETPAVCTAFVFALNVVAVKFVQSLKVRRSARRRPTSTTIDPPSWTLPSRISTAARSPISR